MLTKGKPPPDSVEDIDAELKLAAADSQRVTDPDGWDKWMDDLFGRRLRAEPISPERRAWLEARFPTPRKEP